MNNNDDTSKERENEKIHVIIDVGHILLNVVHFQYICNRNIGQSKNSNKIGKHGCNHLLFEVMDEKYNDGNGIKDSGVLLLDIHNEKKNHFGLIFKNINTYGIENIIDIALFYFGDIINKKENKENTICDIANTIKNKYRFQITEKQKNKEGTKITQIQTWFSINSVGNEGFSNPLDWRLFD